jgi:hypothetical protein
LRADSYLKSSSGARRMLSERPTHNVLRHYWSFAYSALACFRMGMSGSASFQSAKKVRFSLGKDEWDPNICSWNAPRKTKLGSSIHAKNLPPV